MSCQIANAKQDAGRLGGLQTYLRHGSEHMAEIGRLGGRPRLPTRQQSASQDSFHRLNNGKEERLPNGLRKLKTLYRLQNQAGEANSLPQGGGESE